MKVITTVVLLFCLTAIAFASGDRGEIENFKVKTPEPQVYNGTFRIEEDGFPAILTDDGEIYYLMIPNMFIGSDMLPPEGAELSIEAFKAPFSPVHLIVLSAEVDGEEIDMQLEDAYPPWGYYPWGCRYYYGYDEHDHEYDYWYEHHRYGPRGRWHGPRWRWRR